MTRIRCNTTLSPYFVLYISFLQPDFKTMHTFGECVEYRWGIDRPRTLVFSDQNSYLGQRGTPLRGLLQTRLGVGTSAARRFALAGHSRTRAVQARCNSAPVTATEGPVVLRQPWTSPVDSDYALPVVTNFLCRVTNSAHLVIGPSLLLDWRLGISCRLTSVIRHLVTSLSDVHWKHSCSPSTSVFSALEVFLQRCAI